MPHIRTPSHTLAAVALLILLASVGLAACGSSGGSASTSAKTVANAAATGTATGTTSPAAPSTSARPPGQFNSARFTAMRACLAKKGITLPQRAPGAGGFLGGAGPQLPKGVTRAQYTEALKSCGGGFAGRFKGAGGFRSSPRFHQLLARFAACLRQNGIDVGEPNTTGKGPIFDTKGINTGSPQFKAAETKCRSTLIGGFGPKTARPGAAAGASG